MTTQIVFALVILIQADPSPGLNFGFFARYLANIIIGDIVPKGGRGSGTNPKIQSCQLGLL